MEMEEDRISALPDALIHQITSHMDTREVVHTSILSNRWRYTWLSTPYLNFDLDYWYKKTRSRCYRTSFMNFVETVLTRRGSSDHIIKFRLFTYDDSFDSDLPRVSTWIHTCLERNVQHLILRFPLGSLKPEDVDLTTFLPPNLFTSNLQQLEISFVPKPLVPLPNIVHGSIIKDLQLHSVRLPDGNGNGVLNLTSSVLEVLKVDLCDVNHLKAINVSAPPLRKLWVRLGTARKEEKKDLWGSRLKIDQEEKHCNLKVNLDVPSIKSLLLVTFSCESFFPVEYSIQTQLLSLGSAEIHFVTEKFVDKECSEHLMKILLRVYHTRALQLTVCTKQVLNDFPILLEGSPNQFHNLRDIKLGDNMKFPCVEAITNFLSSFPCIETLVWERTWSEWSGVINEAEKSAADKIESLRAGQSQNMFDCLKTAEFLDLQGSELELQFLAFVLERAQFLKKITIQFSHALAGAKLKNLKEKCMCLPRASPNSAISFMKDI